MKKKILIVEDEPPLLKILADQLNKAGFKVLQAEDGEEGLEIAKKEKPDLILLDILMPKMDGEEVFDNLNKEGIKSKVIILTNYSSEEKAKKFEKMGIEYMVKSDNQIVEIIEMCKKVLALN